MVAPTIKPATKCVLKFGIIRLKLPFWGIWVLAIRSLFLNTAVLFVDDDLAVSLVLGDFDRLPYNLRLRFSGDGSSTGSSERSFPFVAFWFYVIRFTSRHLFVPFCRGLVDESKSP